MSEPTKTCSKCGKAKALRDFHRAHGGKLGRRSICAACVAEQRDSDAYRLKQRDRSRLFRSNAPAQAIETQRRWDQDHPGERQRIRRSHILRKKYGITIEQFEEMWTAQRGCCALCQTSKFGRKGPHVDHDHATNKVRALLCHQCNNMLGNARDSTETLLRAVDYLIEHGSPGMLRAV